MQRNYIWLFVWLVSYLPRIAMGQNLVPNGSFETYRTCPRLDNLLEEAVPWYNPNLATPDFYHSCFHSGQLPLPPRSGQGVARLFFDKGWAEYLAVPLTKPLLADECYYFEMYVAMETPAKHLTETFGAHLSAQPLTSTDKELLTAKPQILDNKLSPGDPALKWQRVSGTLKAKGGEKYATIGNFDRLPVLLGFYYLFIDDVSLVPITLNLGNDTTLCGRRSTRLLDATTPGAAFYKWSDGSTDPTLLVTKPGRHSVTVITPCKVLTDTITINYALNFDLGADTTLCNGQAVALSVPANPEATYRWQDGSGQTIYTVRQAGQYSIRVKQGNCTVTDTIRVRYIRPPELELGPNKDLCGAELFTIIPTITEGEFRWQDEFNAIERTVSSSGVFRASVSNDCATVTDSIAISYGACDCVLYAPNCFTPNEDQVNDVFLAYGCGDILIQSLAIFNRWGEVIFQTDTPPFQWDGYYRGTLCVAGTYAWRIRYSLTQGKQQTVDQKQGALSLIR
ncbi:gliding motility-associated C-terminal domain-containing protein [Spirosoma areae]